MGKTVLRFGGVEYLSASAIVFSLEYDLYMQKALQDAGLSDLLTKAQVGVSAEALTVEALGRIGGSGMAAKLLAGMLVPVNVVWSTRSAEQTAEHLNSITDVTEKRQLIALLTEGINSFFLAGRRSSATSRFSLSRLGRGMLRRLKFAGNASSGNGII